MSIGNALFIIVGYTIILWAALNNNLVFMLEKEKRHSNVIYWVIYIVITISTLWCLFT